MPTEQNTEILQAMKEAAAALRDNDIQFALAGGLACWARGGPATEHDVDLAIREEDVERALLALRKAYRRAGTIWLLADRASGHTAQATLALAEALRIEFVWLPSTALAVLGHFLRNISRIRISYRKGKTQTATMETKKLPKQC